MNRRKLLARAAAAGLGLAASPWLRAQPAYPAKPVRVIVPYPPAGSTDLAARIVSTHMQQEFGQPFVVENRPGGAANIGMAAVDRADPDGYTLGVLTTAHAINATLFKKPGFDLRKGLRQIGMIYRGPLVLAVNLDQPFDSVKSLIDYARKNPGKINFASTGIGGSPHLAGELFCLKAGIRMTHIPYMGSAAGITAVMGGVCQVMFDTELSALPHIQAGKVRVFGVSSLERNDLLPQVPTIAEAGVPGYEVTAWNGLCAPAATPDAIVEKLNAALLRAMAVPDIKERMRKLSSVVPPMKAGEYNQFVLDEEKKWAEVIKSAGLEPQ